MSKMIITIILIDIVIAIIKDDYSLIKKTNKTKKNKNVFD